MQDRHSDVYSNAKNVITVFENEYSDLYNDDIRGYMQELWAEYMKGHFTRVTAFARWWAMGKLNSLEPVWIARLSMPPGSTDRLFA